MGKSASRGGPVARVLRAVRRLFGAVSALGAVSVLFSAWVLAGGGLLFWLMSVMSGMFADSPVHVGAGGLVAVHPHPSASATRHTATDAAVAIRAVPGGAHRLLQFTACSDLGRSGCRAADAGRDLVTELTATVLRTRPDVVSLSGVCRFQVDALRNRLRRRGWTLNSTFGTTSTDPSLTCSDHELGNAVLTRASVRSTRTICLAGCSRRSSSQDVHPSAVCARVKLDRQVWACAAQLSLTSRRAQIARLVTVSSSLPGGAPVLLGADLATTPSANVLDPLYGASDGTDLREVDACAARTAATSTCNRATWSGRSGQAKHDYVFTDSGTFPSAQLWFASSRWSDHRAMVVDLHP